MTREQIRDIKEPDRGQIGRAKPGRDAARCVAGFIIFGPQIPCMDVDEIRELVDTADRLEKAGDADGAAGCYDRLIREDPGISLWHIGKAKVYVNAERHVEALACLDRIVGLEPDGNSAWGFYERAYALYHLGRGAEAIANLNRVIELNPGYTNAYFSKGVMLADQYSMRRDPAVLEDALWCYDEATRVDERDCDSLYNKGLLLAEARRTDEAIACYDEAIRRDSGYYRAITSKGDALLDSGKHAAAIACYDEALQANPDHPQALYNMGKALWLCERAEDAYAMLQRAYKMDPELPDCRRILGILEDRMEFDRGLHGSCQKGHDGSGG